MDVLFGILVGVVLAFIGYKWVTMNKKNNNNTNSNSVGGGGYTGVNDGVAGELPKDNIK
jgi:hypothetical protein